MNKELNLKVLKAMTGTETCRTNPGGGVLSAPAGSSGAQHSCTTDILSDFPGYTAGHS